MAQRMGGGVQRRWRKEWRELTRQASKALGIKPSESLEFWLLKASLKQRELWLMTIEQVFSELIREAVELELQKAGV